MGQKAYEYKLEQDDKKEVFCKNALFLLQAPDSLSNRLVDFDLPMDTVVEMFKRNILLDSCNRDLFSFSSNIHLESTKNPTLFAFQTSFISGCNNIVYDKPQEFGYTINVIDEKYYINLFFENKKLRINDLKKDFQIFNQKEKNKYDFEFTIRFKNNVEPEVLDKLIITISTIYIENISEFSQKVFGKALCDLNNESLKRLKKRFNLRIDLQFGQYNDLPPPPPPPK